MYFPSEHSCVSSATYSFVHGTFWLRIDLQLQQSRPGLPRLEISGRSAAGRKPRKPMDKRWLGYTKLLLTAKDCQQVNGGVSFTSWFLTLACCICAKWRYPGNIGRTHDIWKAHLNILTPLWVLSLFSGTSMAKRSVRGVPLKPRGALKKDEAIGSELMGLWLSGSRQTVSSSW